MRRYAVRFAPAAREQLHAIHDWWRANRASSAHIVIEEIARAVSRLGLLPHAARPGWLSSHVSVRRIHLRRIRHYLYYRIIEAAATVEIMSIWHSSRGSEPELNGVGD